MDWHVVPKGVHMEPSERCALSKSPVSETLAILCNTENEGLTQPVFFLFLSPSLRASTENSNGWATHSDPTSHEDESSPILYRANEVLVVIIEGSVW